MADFKFQEKKVIESTLGMGSGCVLDFSDRTFAEFFSDYQIDIDDPKYYKNGGSKAYRLRSFLAIEPEEVVRPILLALLHYAQTVGTPDPKDIDLSSSIIERLGNRESFVVSEQDLSDIWEPGFFRLFLSHLADHKVEASQFKNQMNAYGVSCFVAHEDIDPTSLWQTEIEKALFSMHSLVALLREGFNASKWTDQELGVAFGRQVPIIPIRLGVDPYGLIGKYQAMNGSNKAPTALAEEVYDLLWKDPKLHADLTEGIVSRLEASESWAESKFLMTPMRRIQRLSPDLISRLRQALETNSQVSGSFGVKAKVESLISHAEAMPVI